MSNNIEKPMGYDGSVESMIEKLPLLKEMEACVRKVRKDALELAAETREYNKELPKGLRFITKTKLPSYKDSRLTDETRFKKIKNAGFTIEREDAFKMVEPRSLKNALPEGQRRKFMAEFTEEVTYETLDVDVPSTE